MSQESGVEALTRVMNNQTKRMRTIITDMKLLDHEQYYTHKAKEKCLFCSRDSLAVLTGLGGQDGTLGICAAKCTLRRMLLFHMKYETIKVPLVNIVSKNGITLQEIIDISTWAKKLLLHYS